MRSRCRDEYEVDVKTTAMPRPISFDLVQAKSTFAGDSMDTSVGRLLIPTHLGLGRSSVYMSVCHLFGYSISTARPNLSYATSFELRGPQLWSRRSENPSRTYRRLLGAIKSLAEAFPWKSIGKPKENNSEIMIKAMSFQNHVKTSGSFAKIDRILCKKLTSRHIPIFPSYK